MQFELKKFEKLIFHYLMGACALAMLTAIGVYAYLGTFSRYLSDDYCETVSTKNSIVSGVLDRYMSGDWRAANRTSNLFFVGLSELLGKNSMPITNAAMLILWPIGLSWSAHEVRKFFKINWSVRTDIFIGSALGFFILLQAPNLFQTIYWRSSMMTHFAPLVFGAFLFAFWMKQAANASTAKTSLPAYILIVLGTYVIAGFSEPPVATLVTALGLIIVAVWLWASPSTKQSILPLLTCAFAGAFLGLITMVLSPANTNMVKASPGIIKVLSDSFLFSFIFVVYAFKLFPVPGILSALVSAVLAWFYKQNVGSEYSAKQKQTIWLLILAAPILMWLLIAAGFSPSVYGQGYPVERMRFLACSLMTAALMFEGAMFGLLAGNLKFKVSSTFGKQIAILLLVLIGFIYPLRAALRVYRTDVPEYSTRAQLWDLRNVYIIRHASLGEMDLVVPGFSGVHNIKEVDDNPNHWVNLCVAKFYGLHSIRAVTVPDDLIMEYLSE